MTRRKKVGFVRVWRDQSGQWRARYRKLSTGEDVRRILPVATEGEAVAAAMEINKGILDERGIIPSAKRKRGEVDSRTVRDALLEPINLSRANEITRASYRKAANWFLAFLSERYPSIRRWQELRPSILEAWIGSMIDKGWAPDSVRIALVPVRRASAYWSSEEPEKYRDFARGRRAHFGDRQPREIPVLEVKELAAFLDWIKGGFPSLSPIAHLMGLCGMRTWEAAFLRHCDVDWQAGTIRIAASPFHRPKNSASHRTIPAHPEVLAAIRVYLESVKVQGAAPESPLFLNAKGKPWMIEGLSSAWARAMKAARETLKLPGLEGFQPRRLRASFATICRRAKVETRLLQSYLGHRPSLVLDRHYAKVTLDDLRAEVAEVFGRHWAEVARKSGQDSGNAIDEA